DRRLGHHRHRHLRRHRPRRPRRRGHPDPGHLVRLGADQHRHRGHRPPGRRAGGRLVAPVANVGVTSTPRMVPYLSVDMMKNHRRRGVQLDNLVVRGRPDEQDAALAELIESASVWIDNTILMPIGGLAATYETDLVEVSPDRYGYVRLHPR